jgi:oligopeptide transport system permease protein
MTSFFLKRIGYMLITLFIVVSATFFLVKFLPGTPYNNPEKLTDQQLAVLDAKYGLDQPIAIQYVRYLANLAQGDLGMSFKHEGRTVYSMISDRIGPSALIGFQALIFGTVMGLILGIISALKHNSLLDYGSVSIAVFVVKCLKYWDKIMLLPQELKG